jgi:hypothetical protein
MADLATARAVTDWHKIAVDMAAALRAAAGSVSCLVIDEDDSEQVRAELEGLASRWTHEIWLAEFAVPPSGDSDD